MPHVWLLHNTRAGRLAYRQGVDQAAEALTQRGARVQLERAENIGALKAAARRAVAAHADAVLVAGGDGTLGAIASELAGTQVALGALPAGTANVWARELRLPMPAPHRPNALAQAALLLLDSPARAVDLGQVNGRWFLAWTGVGLDAYVSRQFELRRDSTRPLSGYIYNTLLALQVASRYRPVDLRLRVSGPRGEHELSGRYLMVTVANIGLHGGGWLRLTRDARLNDGLMDVWAVSAGGLAAKVWELARVLLGRPPAAPTVTRLTGDRFEIYTADPQVVHIDAEPQPATQHLAVTVVPHSLRMLVPPAAAGDLFREPLARQPEPP